MVAVATAMTGVQQVNSHVCGVHNGSSNSNIIIGYGVA